jgi:hypothetical protein
MKNLKILCIFLSCGLVMGCKHQSTATEQITNQIPLIPVMIDLDSGVYAALLTQPPSLLTNKIYDASISKAMLLQRMLSEGKYEDQFESHLEIREINSLCFMGKFLLSRQHKGSLNLQGNTYDTFFTWFSAKQRKWEKILANEKVLYVYNPCISNTQ